MRRFLTLILLLFTLGAPATALAAETDTGPVASEEVETKSATLVFQEGLPVEQRTAVNDALREEFNITKVDWQVGEPNSGIVVLEVSPGLDKDKVQETAYTYGLLMWDTCDD